MKKWAEKGIILCPACGKPYEYCHGRIKRPYFRHADKDICDMKYYEPETDEHISGKLLLFDWLKSLGAVTNVVLEGWLSDTKQRPDIMFKIGEKQFVIEYQCSPISSEYLERHDLYNAAGITDIWVIGIEKYKTGSSPYIKGSCTMQLDSQTKQFIVGNRITSRSYKNYYRYGLHDMKVDINNVFIHSNGKIYIKSGVFEQYSERDEIIDKEIAFYNQIKNSFGNNTNIKCFGKSNSQSPYDVKIEFNIFDCLITGFVKNGVVDFCHSAEYKKPILKWSDKKYQKTFRGTYTASKYELIFSLEYEMGNYDSFKDCVERAMQRIKRGER